ncbi:MAG: acyl-CoA synthetase FdrA [Chromatiales bacterium]|nr:acyl-CoA synthetase FdrA [Chromatiales bacterium]
MSAVVVNEVRRGFYLDSVALMRVSAAVRETAGVEAASLMIGTPSNLEILAEAGLLADAGRAAGPNDLVLAVRATDDAAAGAALAAAVERLDGLASGAVEEGGGRVAHAATLEQAMTRLPQARLALISVPGAYAAREARRALRAGLHVMIFSDNVSIEDERALKLEAAERGLLVMGPDCGTALIGGTPLAFANAVPRGDVGLVAASGTGMQEVSVLLARAGAGVSHGIGVGGRDLYDAVGGLSTLAALDGLEADPGTRSIVLISKPPGADTAARIAHRLAACTKPVVACFLGHPAPPGLPPSVRYASTLHEAASLAVGRSVTTCDAEALAGRLTLPANAGVVRGLFTGGTLCAEAQVVLARAGVAVASNAPVPAARAASEGAVGVNLLLDLGADEYTLGRPHPMIEPVVRVEPLRAALADPSVAVVLLDVVLGHGAHADPVAAVVDTIAAAGAAGPAVVASVCGTDADPQGLGGQVRRLEAAGVVVAPSNADAAAVAAAALRRIG